MCFKRETLGIAVNYSKGPLFRRSTSPTDSKPNPTNPNPVTDPKPNHTNPNPNSNPNLRNSGPSG